MDVNELKDMPPWDWPRNTGESLRRILEDQTGASEADRVVAARLAGDLVVMDDEIAEVLLSIVQRADQPAPLRAQAAISLGPVLEQTDSDGFEDDLLESPITKEVFERIQEALHKTYLDSDGVPKLVRRRALEAAIRASQDWHQDAVRSAYASEDEEWKLTAVFCMRWIEGFDKEILKALESPDSQIHREAVRSAGVRALEAAWPHITGLLAAKNTAKPLLLAAIAAVAEIRPTEAPTVLAKFAHSKDKEIAEAASEAIEEASLFGEDFDDEEDEDEEDEDMNYGSSIH